MPDPDRWAARLAERAAHLSATLSRGVVMAESRDITVNVRVEGLEKLTEALEALRTVQIDGEKIAEVLNRAAGRASRPRRLHEPLSEETGA